MGVNNSHPQCSSYKLIHDICGGEVSGMIFITDSNFVQSVMSEHMLRIKFTSTSCKIALGWMPQNAFDDKSTLV